MRLNIAIIILSLIAIAPLKAYQAATAIIQEQLVDNHKEHIGIRSQLTEEEADEIILYLQERGISAEKKVSSTDQANRMSNQIWEVFVIPTDTVEAITLLDEAGLPNRRRSSIFEEFVNRIREGYTMTEPHQILAKQIEDYVENQPGIVNAEVLIKWDRDPFQDEEVLKTLLYIRHTGSLDDPHSEFAEGLKKHILDNVDNLEDEHLIFVTEREAPLNYELPDYTE